MPVRQNPCKISVPLRNIFVFNRLQYTRKRSPLLGLYLMHHDEDILGAVTGAIAQSGIPNAVSLGLLDLPGSLRVTEVLRTSSRFCATDIAPTPWPAFLFPRKVVRGRFLNGCRNRFERCEISDQTKPLLALSRRFRLPWSVEWPICSERSCDHFLPRPEGRIRPTAAPGRFFVLVLQRGADSARVPLRATAAAAPMMPQRLGAVRTRRHAAIRSLNTSSGTTADANTFASDSVLLASPLSPVSILVSVASRLSIRPSAALSFAGIPSPRHSPCGRGCASLIVRGTPMNDPRF